MSERNIDMPPPNKAPQFLPTLRNSGQTDFTFAIGNVARQIISDPTHFPYKNCLNCRHFNEQLEHCKKFNSRPPARVIAFSCKEHEDVSDNDEIPF